MKAAILPMLALLAGCATPPPATAIKEPLNARPQAMAASAGNGAIFQTGDSRPRTALALFEDRKARHVGDTLTVNLVEKTEAKRKSETTDERKANASLNIPGPVVLGNGPIVGATTWVPSASNKQEFKDNETNSNEFKGAITVTVVEVLANGHLVVAGERSMAQNGGSSTLRFGGIVDPRDIQPGNLVASGDVVNARVELVGAGELDETGSRTWLQRFLTDKLRIW